MNSNVLCVYVHVTHVKCMCEDVHACVIVYTTLGEITGAGKFVL